MTERVWFDLKGEERIVAMDRAHALLVARNARRPTLNEVYKEIEDNPHNYVPHAH